MVSHGVDGPTRPRGTPARPANVDEYKEHGPWLNLARGHACYTLDGLPALFADYIALLNKYGHTAEGTPPGARPMHLRFFHLPDEG